MPESDLIYIIVIKKGSFGFETLGLGWKWHQHTVIFKEPHAILANNFLHRVYQYLIKSLNLLLYPRWIKMFYTSQFFLWVSLKLFFQGILAKNHIKNLNHSIQHGTEKSNDESWCYFFIKWFQNWQNHRKVHG